MSKGTVMSIDQKWATIFTEDCQLIKLPLQPNMAVGKEVRINMERKNEKTANNILRFKPALIAASFVLVLALSLLFSQGLIFNPVYAQVSIDVNPSLQLSLSRQLRVLSVKAMNQEAERMMVGENYQGLGLEEAIYRWTKKLQASQEFQVKTMLLSAVMPDRAEALKTQLMQLEETQNQGDLKNIAVRFIFSNDEAVAKQAQKNGLSIGRQMLLNQAQVQNENYNSESIAIAPLDELIPTLLKNQEHNQTRLTERTTQSLSDPSGSGTTATNRNSNTETNRNTSGSASNSSSGSATGSGPATSATNQFTNRNTNGSTQSTGTGSAASSQYTNQFTNGSTQSSATGTTATNQETKMETNGSTQGTGTGSNATSQSSSTSGSGTGTGGTGKG